ncbi:MAG: thioether cross-link-forming SCIFF peptide maturase [Clostridiales bacterium]|nr:thioether cross-link-forming SCIFF peptide maturase [Clostridiales bacterium]
MIHRFKNNGYNIVLDTNSGAVHVMDEVAYDIVGMYEESDFDTIVSEITKKHGVSESEVRECIDDIKALAEAGQLFSEDTYENIEPMKRGGDVIKALCLHVAHTCNLNCTYCFAGQGKYHGSEALMSEETACRAIDFLIENSGDRRNLEVDFFGGEPLMNFDVVKKTVAYAREREKDSGKNFRFTLTTNGMLIDDDVIDFANRECHNVVLSLDGRPEVHDRLRRTYKGEGSYERIVPRFKKLAESRGGEGYYIRGTYTHYNTDFASDVLHMADLGFSELSMEPVVCPLGDPYALTEEDLPVLYEQYDLLAREMIKRRREGKPITFYHYMIDLENGPCIHKRIAGCGSGSEYMAVTPTGDLYPCHQFVNDPAYLLGNVTGGVKRHDICGEFKKCNVYSHPECRDCWAKFYCSGGCAANAYHATGKINGVYDYGCRLFKHRVECAIMLKVSEEDDSAE